MSFVFKTRVKTRLADTDTPVGIYLKIRDQLPESILMESGSNDTADHKYSYICCLPIASFIVVNEQIRIQLPDGTTKTSDVVHTNVLSELADFSTQFGIQSTEEHFNTKGLFGYISYDAVRYFESITLTAPVASEQKIPDLHFSFYSLVLVFDHAKNICHIIEYLPEEKEFPNVSPIEAFLNHKHIPHYPFHTIGEEKCSSTDEAYLKMVELGKQHCYRGDVFQVVLSRSFSTAYSGDDFNVFRALRSINPSPYLFYFDYGDYHLFGSSPEAQLKIKNDTASIHPIAGTYRRTGNTEADLLQAEQLKQDSKENAEHVMLVDLARNDLSKSYKDVAVTVYKDIQLFSHVIHIVSEVTGMSPVEKQQPLKIIADTFPAGTLSGAPKYKAIQLIDTYENQARGFYGGCIGYLGFNGDFNQAIMIRSFLSKNNTLFYQAGAGIVASSVLENELKEIDNKLRALRTALATANILSV